ncbi:hypothetical protein F5876DRAFT_39705, partial [Lentinula aff. lateritia]
VQIEYILADIPLFCVGLMAFAFFAFMLVMKRVTLLSIYLYSTALFSFVAAVIDLAQLLVRGSVKVNMNTGITSGVTALINTREVGLSIAIGFRFLFFWAFVAERPRGEPPPTTDLSDPRVYVHHAQNSHSAKWERWGYLGIFLKWLILASVISIPILQIIWRIAVRHFGVVYMVESTIEILISALLLLKMILNVFLSPVSPWWKPFRFYVAPLIALLINLGIGIGELVYFLFSETALGRFLQAFEVYLMIIFLMLVAFYKVPVRPIRPSVSTSYMVDKKPQNTQSVAEAAAVVDEPAADNDPQTRLSMVPRVRSWMIPSRRQSNVGRQQNTEDVEAALTLPSSQPIQQPKQPLGSENRTSAGVSLRYYGVGHDSLMSYPNPSFMANDESSLESSGTDSPIYGLDGIVKQQKDRNSAGSSLRPPRRPSLSSFDELIQQQAELDRSIAALRLFSPPISFAETENPSAGIPDGTSLSTTNNRTVSTLTSSSARSEFSLSIFPDPPIADFPLRASFSTMRANRTKRQSRRDLPTSFDNVSLDVPSLPDTPMRLAPGRSFGSNATQYDVTSFIGRESMYCLYLTRPSVTEGLAQSEAANAPSLTNVSEEVKADTKSDAPVAEDLTLTKETSYPQLRPFFLGNVTTSPAVSSPLAEGARGSSTITVGPRKPVRGRLALPSNPRPIISAPMQSSLDQAPGAFESPRPPPSFSKSSIV